MLYPSSGGLPQNGGGALKPPPLPTLMMLYISKQGFVIFSVGYSIESTRGSFDDHISHQDVRPRDNRPAACAHAHQHSCHVVGGEPLRDDGPK